MKKEEKVILYDSEEAAQKVQVWAWKDSKGYYHFNEGSARYSGSTHMACECGELMRVGYTKCPKCSEISRKEKFLKQPFEEWDLTSMVCTDYGHDYFSSEEEVIEYLEENDLQEIDLLIATPLDFSEVREDYWDDELGEEGELPEEMRKALDALNKIIREQTTSLYWPSNIRTHYKLKTNGNTEK